jgi:hypothetical protein
MWNQSYLRGLQDGGVVLKEYLRDPAAPFIIFWLM